MSGFGLLHLPFSLASRGEACGGEGLGLASPQPSLLGVSCVSSPASDSWSFVSAMFTAILPVLRIKLDLEQVHNQY